MKGSKESLPAFYNDNMIGFFPQDPSVAFVYWELSSANWKAATEMGGVLIRLYRVWVNESQDYEYILEREIPPPPYTGNWYFEGLEPGTRFCVEIGGKLFDGSFLPVVKSEIISMPPEPKFDTMPKLKASPGHKEEELQQEKSFAGGKLRERAQNNLNLAEVFSSMPFYMGYRSLV